MDAYRYVNISAEIISCIVCLILLLCVITDGGRKDKLHRMYIYVLCCHIPLMLVDTMIFIFDGRTGLYANFIFRLAYFLSFVLGAVLLILFSQYILTLITIKSTISKKTVYSSQAAVAVCGINIALILLTQFFGLYYSIDASNIFYRGGWYWLSQVLAFLCIFINTGIIIIYRKSFGMREFVFLLSYAVLPVAALIVHNVATEVVASIDVATMLTILIFYIGIQSEQSKQLKMKELELAESRISVMLSQIQPHFIYNSLVMIKQLCDIDPQKAKEAVVEFSAYLRSNLDSLSLKKNILFETELNHVENYLALERKRFGNRVNVRYDIHATGFRLPALTLQPIVENAVRYGITKKEKGGTITISSMETKDDFVITIADDGVGFDPLQQKNDERSHIGINNVRSRLQTMRGGDLTIESSSGHGTVATIRIPKENKDNEIYYG